MSEREIVLEMHYDENGKYLGKTVIYESQITPEFLNLLKEDTEETKGWRKYRKVMKEAGFDIEPEPIEEPIE